MIRRAVLQAQANVAAGSAPCLLTREQLGPGPGEFMLRQMRAVRDRYEIEAAKQRERESLTRLALAKLKEFENGNYHERQTHDPRSHA